MFTGEVKMFPGVLLHTDLHCYYELRNNGLLLKVFNCVLVKLFFSCLVNVWIVNCICIFAYQEVWHFFSIVCFIYLFMFIMILFDLLGTMLVCFYAFGNHICNTPIYLTLFTILTLQKMIWIELNYNMLKKPQNWN